VGFLNVVGRTYISSDKKCEGRGGCFFCFHEIHFESLGQVKTLADLPSGYTDKHHREGVVLRSADNGQKMAKVIGETYLEGKGRTERH